MSSGVSGALSMLQPRDVEWRFVDAFPNADAETQAKLAVMDELRERLHRDDSLVPIDEHLKYCLLVCQLALTLHVERGVKSAIPELWFQNGNKASNCVWFEVVCQTLDMARRAFTETFEYERLSNPTSRKKRQRLLSRYSTVLSLLKFVEEWVYANWRGHNVVLQYMRAYQKPSCRDLANLTGAYVAWCMNLLHRNNESFQGLVNSTQQVCKDLSIASCVLLASVYDREQYEFYTLNALRRTNRLGTVTGTATTSPGLDATTTDDSKSDTSATANGDTATSANNTITEEERKNWFYRTHGSDMYIETQCEATTEKKRRNILRHKYQGKWRYHYLFEQSMNLMTSASAMSATSSFASPFTDGDEPLVQAYDEKTMRYCTWTEACMLLSIVDLADFAFSRNSVGIALALYECAAHNGVFLSQYHELTGFRRSMRTHEIPATVEPTLKKSLRSVPKVFRVFMDRAMYDVIDEATPFILDPQIQATHTTENNNSTNYDHTPRHPQS